MYAQPISDLPAFAAAAILVIYDIRKYKGAMEVER